MCYISMCKQETVLYFVENNIVFYKLRGKKNDTKNQREDPKFAIGSPPAAGFHSRCRFKLHFFRNSGRNLHINRVPYE